MKVTAFLIMADDHGQWYIVNNISWCRMLRQISFLEGGGGGFDNRATAKLARWTAVAASLPHLSLSQ